MIRLKRDRSKDVIHHNFYGKRKETFEKELLLEERRFKRGEIEKRIFKSGRWKPAKKQLLAETGGKCAYCEAPTSVVAFGDVEHYRPKSSYWWLAYCYDNYLVSCQLCNQRFKKTEKGLRRLKTRKECPPRPYLYAPHLARAPSTCCVPRHDNSDAAPGPRRCTCNNKRRIHTACGVTLAGKTAYISLRTD